MLRSSLILILRHTRGTKCFIDHTLNEEIVFEDDKVCTNLYEAVSRPADRLMGCMAAVPDSSRQHRKKTLNFYHHGVRKQRRTYLLGGITSDLRHHGEVRS